MQYIERDNSWWHKRGGLRQRIDRYINYRGRKEHRSDEAFLQPPLKPYLNPLLLRLHTARVCLRLTCLFYLKERQNEKKFIFSHFSNANNKKLSKTKNKLIINIIIKHFKMWFKIHENLIWNIFISMSGMVLRFCSSKANNFFFEISGCRQSNIFNLNLKLAPIEFHVYEMCGGHIERVEWKTNR